jgi:hypothetical protein
MTLTDTALPEVVSRDEWLAARKALLAMRRRMGPPLAAKTVRDPCHSQGDHHG